MGKHSSEEKCIERGIIECKKIQTHAKWAKFAAKLIDENLLVSQCEFDTNNKYDTLCGNKFIEAGDLIVDAGINTMSASDFDIIEDSSLSALRQVDITEQAYVQVYRISLSNLQNDRVDQAVPLSQEIMQFKIPNIWDGVRNLNAMEDLLFTASDDHLVHDGAPALALIESAEHTLREIVERLPYITPTTVTPGNLNYANMSFDGKFAKVGYLLAENLTRVYIFFYIYKNC